MKRFLSIQLEDGDLIARDMNGFLYIRTNGNGSSGVSRAYRSTKPGTAENEIIEVGEEPVFVMASDSYEWKEFRKGEV